jgi:hypothetical protein
LKPRLLGPVGLVLETFDVALDAARHGVFFPELLLVTDTIDGPGVEGEGSLGNEGGDEDDHRANAELKTVENR